VLLVIASIKGYLGVRAAGSSTDAHPA